MKEGFSHATDAGIRLTGFLRDRFDDDKNAALTALDCPFVTADDSYDVKWMWLLLYKPAEFTDGWGSMHIAGAPDPYRVIDDADAKHKVLDAITEFLPISLNPMTPAGVVALALAQPYADHPDFDPDWRSQ